MSAELRVAGLTPLTTIDFPGRLAAVVFLQGCPWRCSYCHNPALIPPTAPTPWSWEQVIAFLGTRQGLLDGVVFSGGEPTLQAALPDAIDAVRAMGFQVGLHTAGMYPERVAAILPRLDWIGLDVKAPDHRHHGIVGVQGAGPRVHATLEHVLASGVAHECRTTWHPSLYGADELLALGQALAEAGVTHWAVQPARLDGQPEARVPPSLVHEMSARFDRFCVR